MNIRNEIQKAIDAAFDERVFLATVTAVTGGIVRVLPAGSQTEIAQSLACLTSYASPTVGDKVRVERLSSGYLVLGKVRTS